MSNTNPYDFSGRIALVTGATSGLGRHFAKLLAAHGAAVALAGRRIDRLNAVKAEIEAAGGKAAAIPLDVTEAKAIAPAFDAIQGTLGGTVDILINNAGLSRFGLSLELTADDF
ncbi:MAG: SDR family NAD(P)-dependent oxidoreductase, partial [Alphaproteobacteria bacterium]|nr:SDR family NAD(P)-dependent oxidoreductase [Alphaproteobacteria bacterium]